MRGLRCFECVCCMSVMGLMQDIACIAMGSAVLLMLRSRLLIYSAVSAVNRVQVVVCISWLHLCVWM